MPTVGLDPVWSSSTGTSSIASAAFSPAAGSLIVIDAIADSGATGITASIVDSVGLTWTAIGTVQDGGSGGAAMAWWAYTASAQTGMTATVTWAGSGVTNTKAIKVSTLTGTASVAAVITKAQGTSATNNLTVNITTTNAGCRVSGCAIDWNALGAPTSTDTITAFHAATAISGAAVRKAADSGSAGSSVGLNFDAFGASAPDWGYKVYEIVPAAGGTAFTRTVDDPAGLADATAALVTRTATDTAGLTDAAVAASAFVRTQTDTVGLVDTAAVVSAFTRTVTDTTGLTDSGLAQGRTAEGTDSAGLTDSATAQLTSGTLFTRAATDTAGLADTAAAALTLTRTVTDTTGLTDAGMAQTLTATGNESTGLTDSVSTSLNGGGLSLTRTVTDLLGLADLGAPQTLDVAETVNDSAGLTDTASPVLTLGGFTRTVTDTTGLVDTATTVSVFARAQTDTAGLSDATSVQLAAAGTRTIDDAAGLTDAITMAVARAIPTTDSAGLTDSVLAQLNAVTVHTRTITDSAGLRSSHRCVRRTHRTVSGVTIRPNTGTTPRYALVPD